jgi:hypothetical protein
LVSSPRWLFITSGCGLELTGAETAGFEAPEIA